MYINTILPTNQDNQLNSKQISDLSHELRAPLFNIRSFLETLYEYNNELNSEQRLEFLEIATNETNRLNNLVRDVLEIAKLENKKNDGISESAIINIVREIIQLNEITSLNKQLLLFLVTEDINESMLSNYNILVRILSNLLNNAIKFTYPKGIISIQTKILISQSLESKMRRAIIRISILDTGIGISKKDQKNIFNRFSRANKENNIVTGSGLGLSIVKEKLSKQNQKLNLSTHPYKGSSFSFNLNKIVKLEKGLEPATY